MKLSGKKGFTLVELSIVLVVIGLLIGGILVGQSLVESAKINSVIKQFQQIDIAIGNFQGKYKAWPGDSRRHTTAGDGDNILENSIMNGGGTTTNGAFDFEVANFWKHLQQDAFLAKEYPAFSSTATSGLRAGSNIPYLLTDKKTGIVPYMDSNSLPLYYLKPRFMIANFESSTDSAYAQGTAAVTPSLSVGLMMALDSKIDDGIAYTSNLLLYSAGITHTSATTSSCYTASGTYYKYNASYTGNCTMFILMKAQTTGGI